MTKRAKTPGKPSDNQAISEETTNMKVALCSCFIAEQNVNPAEYDYVSVTDSLKAFYCRTHENVDFVCSKENPHPGRDPHFCKFSMLLYAFLKGYDWAIWMDADAAPVNMGFDIAEYLSRQDKEHMLIQKDVNGINSGVFAMPNTSRSDVWLRMLDTEKVDEFFRNSKFWDQDAIESLLETEQFSDFAVEPDKSIGFNNYEVIYPAADTPIPNEYRKGDWVLHIPGAPNGYRYRRFLRELERSKRDTCPVCGAVAKPYFHMGGRKEADFCVCPTCDLIFSPKMGRMPKEDLERDIYNDNYADVCPDFGEKSDAEMHDLLIDTIVQRQERVLDYAGGRGGFAAKLRAHDISADSCDPFFGKNRKPPTHLKYSLVTCLNSLNNIYDLNAAFDDFRRLLVPGGTLIVIAPVHDDNPEAFGTTPDKWPFLVPARGDVCVCAKATLRRLAVSHGLNYREENSNYFMHVFEKVNDD